MKKKTQSWNIHKIMHLTLTLLASVLFGILAGRVMVTIGNTTSFKERRAELVSFVTGRPKFDFRKSQHVVSEPYQSSRGLNP